jgi:hypothetical protein
MQKPLELGVCIRTVRSTWSGLRTMCQRPPGIASEPIQLALGGVDEDPRIPADCQEW